MDLNTFLPDSDPNWEIRNEFIYYRKIIKVPILSIISEKVWIILDFKVKNQISKLIKHLSKLDVDFYFLNNLLSGDKEIYQENIPTILKSYLTAISDDDFYKDIKVSGFDFAKNLTKFIIEWNCLDLFLEEYKIYCERFLRKFHTLGNDYYLIENPEIRGYIKDLERLVKINLILLS
jgi:hypothetical protein